MVPGGVRRADGLDLVRREVEKPAVAALQLGGRVLVGADGQVDVAVHVVQHGLHGGGPAGQEQVLGVGPADARAHDHPAAAGHPHAGDHDVVGLR